MISPVDRRPRYLQAAEALSDLLDSDYTAGSLLPSTDLLAQRIGVSRSTLREAMSYMERDGRLVRKQGRGTFVAKGTTGLLVNRLERCRVFATWQLPRACPANLSSTRSSATGRCPSGRPRWALTRERAYVHVHNVLSIAGRRVAYFENMVGPDPVAPGLLTERPITALEYLCISGGPMPMYTDSRIIAAKADDRVSARLGIRPGDAVLKMLEIFYSDNGQPLAFQQAHLLTDYLDYRLVRRVAWHPRSGQNGLEIAVELRRRKSRCSDQG